VISDPERESVAQALARAERDRMAIEPPTATHPGFDVADAYAIQRYNVQTRLRAGEVVRGHKVGLTSRQMQEMLGVDEPDYGHILDTMLVPDGGEVDRTSLCWPRVEIEVAFLLGRELRGPGISAADVLRATEAVAPAIEIIDSRICDWKITLADTVADNASSARVVVGRPVPVPADLASLDAELHRNGAVVESGVTGAVLGNPAHAVAWLANKLASFGVPLAAGHIVMPGSCTRAVDVAAGDVIAAHFAAIGSVSVSFV
jgi:2-keto-4-pentenoate hydratase